MFVRSERGDHKGKKGNLQKSDFGEQQTLQEGGAALFKKIASG